MSTFVEINYTDIEEERLDWSVSHGVLIRIFEPLEAMAKKEGEAGIARLLEDIRVSRLYGTFHELTHLQFNRLIAYCENSYLNALREPKVYKIEGDKDITSYLMVLSVLLMMMRNDPRSTDNNLNCKILLSDSEILEQPKWFCDLIQEVLLARRVKTLQTSPLCQDDVCVYDLTQVTSRDLKRLIEIIFEMTEYFDGTGHLSNSLMVKEKVPAMMSELHTALVRFRESANDL